VRESILFVATNLGNSQKIFPQILVVSLSIRDEHPGFTYDQTQDDYVTIDLHMRECQPVPSTGYTHHGY